MNLRAAQVRIYIDADLLGLGKLLAGLRNDVTYPGDPGAVIHKRQRAPCPITSPDVLVAGVAGRPRSGGRAVGGWLGRPVGGSHGRGLAGGGGAPAALLQPAIRAPPADRRWSPPRRSAPAVSMP